MRTHHLMKILTLSLSCQALMACGFKTKDRNVDEVNGIKKAAVVAFVADLPARGTVGLSLNTGKIAGEAGGSQIATTSSTAEEMLKSITQSFGEKLGWKMMPHEQLTQTPSYRVAFKKTMEGWQNKMPPPKGYNRYLSKDTMDGDGLRILSPIGRRELMDGLGVDALVVARVNVLLNSTTVMGIGGRRPQTQVYFEVYKRNQDAPVWFETITGTEKESVGSTHLTLDESKIASFSLESLKDGLKQLQ